MKAANDNGLASAEALQYSVRNSFANLLRVMRGVGEPRRVLNDLEHIASLTESSRADPVARGESLQGVLAGLHFWRPDEYQPNPTDRAERCLCEAALRFVAAKLDQNRMQLSRARQDLWNTCNEIWRERDEAFQRSIKARVQSRMDEVLARANSHVFTSAANDNAIAASQPAESYVYFVTDGEAIKIGKANDPRSRLSGLQTSHHKHLAFLALTPGDESLEKELHRIFDAHRIRGEWFKDCAEIRSLIDDINAGRYSAAAKDAA